MNKELLEIESVIGKYKSFLDKIFGNLQEAGFDVDEFKELDHIAYRVESLGRYKEIKNKLADFSTAQSDEIFATRPVLICRLKNSIEYKGFKIEGIEVLAPKESSNYKDGLEHAEFVTKIALSEFLKKHEDIKFKLDAYSRETNPELIIEFDGCAVKFHAQSLLKVRGI